MEPDQKFRIAEEEILLENDEEDKDYERERDLIMMNQQALE